MRSRPLLVSFDMKVIIFPVAAAGIRFPCPKGYYTLPISSDMKSHKLPTIIELAWKAGVSNWNWKIIALAAGGVGVHIGSEMGIRGEEFSWGFHKRPPSPSPIDTHSAPFLFCVIPPPPLPSLAAPLVAGYIKIDVQWYLSLFCRLYWCCCVISPIDHVSPVIGQPQQMLPPPRALSRSLFYKRRTHLF